MNVRIHKGKKRSVIAHVGDRCYGFAIEQHVERRNMISHQCLPLADMRAVLAQLHR